MVLGLLPVIGTPVTGEDITASVGEGWGVGSILATKASAVPPLKVGSQAFNVGKFADVVQPATQALRLLSKTAHSA